MDEVFIHRFDIVVEFPFPDESERRRIWSMSTGSPTRSGFRAQDP
jgi:hypothetical protein